MDLNAAKLQALMDQVEKLELKIDAICKAYNIDLQYNPHSYEAFQAPKEEN